MSVMFDRLPALPAGGWGSTSLRRSGYCGVLAGRTVVEQGIIALPGLYMAVVSTYEPAPLESN